MQLALMVEGQENVTWHDWCALAAACEEHGIATLFRSDHYISQSDEFHGVAHDAWTTIAALAARTTTLRFGTLVSPATFRAPGLLANAVATADHVSGGRVELGIGAGWMEREHRAFGFDFPDTSVRVERFAEQLEIVHRLWTEERVDFRGLHYTLEDAPGLPKPVQQPRPPNHCWWEWQTWHRRARAPLRRRVQRALRLGRRGRGDPGKNAATALLRHD
jgi:alkanesulfonate monooxygenase SsuD/methylene tetrahydromethanopterin reductase-like flavin-dependent oxidoreductase (luciferase family)